MSVIGVQAPQKKEKRGLVDTISSGLQFATTAAGAYNAADKAFSGGGAMERRLAESTPAPQEATGNVPEATEWDPISGELRRKRTSA